MKVSYRNFKTLEYLNLGIGKYQPINESDLDFFMSNKMLIRNNFNESISDFKNEICYVSSTFEEASKKSVPQLLKLYQAITDKSDLDIKGTFINKYYTFFISFKTKKDDDSIYLKSMCFRNSDGVPICLQIKNNLIDLDWVSNDLKEYEAIQATISPTLYYLFKKYAQVETKIMKANSKEFGINCKYVNDTKSDICILDSKWFTELVNSNSFGVRGHFRLQPKKKDGEWTKELIWINDFVKHGYHRNAGINIEINKPFKN